MPRTLPTVPVHPYSAFTWAGGSGSAEASDFKQTALAGQVYADACDVGFYVQSPRRKMLFVESAVERVEGEVTATHYLSAEGFKIIVFND